MAPVIRISDQLFERLKKHAEPLVDTPSDVIEHLLNSYETNLSHLAPESNSSISTPSPQLELASVFKSNQFNIFLVPAIKENMRYTIEKGVNLNTAKQFFSSSEFEALKKALGGKTDFYCWATTNSNRTTFREMQQGDFALLTEKGTGKFTVFGEIIAKFKNAALGDHLWPVVPGKPWELIYIFSSVRHINIDKSKLVNELGYQSNYTVPGIIRVQPSRVNRLLSRHNSIENFINSF